MARKRGWCFWGGVDTSMYTMQKLTNNNKRFQTVFVQFLLPFIGSKLETTYTIVSSYKVTKSVSKHSFNVVWIYIKLNLENFKFFLDFVMLQMHHNLLNLLNRICRSTKKGKLLYSPSLLSAIYFFNLKIKYCFLPLSFHCHEECCQYSCVSTHNPNFVVKNSSHVSLERSL